MSERWIRQVMVAAAYATPFHSLSQQPFSLSLSLTTILLPFEPSLYTPASRECSTAILCYQTMNSNENKKPPRQRFPKPTRCWSTPSTMRTSFAVVKSKYALFLFIRRPFPSSLLYSLFPLCRWLYHTASARLPFWHAARACWHKNVNAATPRWLHVAGHRDSGTICRIFIHIGLARVVEKVCWPSMNDGISR